MVLRTAHEVAPLVGATAEFLEVAAELGWTPAQRGPDGRWLFDVDALIDGRWIDPRVLLATRELADDVLRRAESGGTDA